MIMKKFVFATLMCVAAMSAKAQVLTSETVNNVYEAVSNKADGDYCYNAERKGKDITTMFVYQKATNSKGDITLKPHLKYEYDYALDGTLKNRVAYRWNECHRDWECTARYDYTLTDNNYFAEFSRYNQKANRFDLPLDRMVYTLKDSINHVICYHRDRPSASFQLVSETAVKEPFVLLAKK